MHHHTDSLREGRLVRVPNCCEAPAGGPDVPATETAALLLDGFDRGGTFVGVFDAEALVGVSEPDDIHLLYPL